LEKQEIWRNSPATVSEYRNIKKEESKLYFYHNNLFHFILNSLYLTSKYLCSALRSSSHNYKASFRWQWNAKDARIPWRSTWKKMNERKKQRRSKIKKRNLNRKLRNKKNARKINVSKRKRN